MIRKEWVLATLIHLQILLGVEGTDKGSAEEITVFLNFMKLRFPEEKNLNYSGTWFRRILSKRAWGKADLESQAALKLAGYNEDKELKEWL